ncbi:hypothetical protein [Fischerella sp. PCC 9605]|uniref:hypothetical protein n=1 Tax=Fischerella sp. PCC 9605 TaxID=1173024 RepID=UPI0012DBE929|nr:hypothetical protein [Fischerella sp. PCC 9605]
MNVLLPLNRKPPHHLPQLHSLPLTAYKRPLVRSAIALCLCWSVTPKSCRCALSVAVGCGSVPLPVPAKKLELQ